MAVPRHHLSKGRQGRRRSHLALKAMTLIACSHCKKSISPHRVCKFCGYYRGREVVNVLAKDLKRQGKNRARQAA
ncbi:MAG: 50S ribosomal protein L32 [Candidatus Yanofskybacteria bacterium]|nr:50S ribosomal protein L32 [Candidatus Yanofskybacteria bacterium]